MLKYLYNVYMNYLVLFGDNTLHKTFRTDEDVIAFCKYLTFEYECNGYMSVMREVPYEDHLGTGFYWTLIWDNKNYIYKC
jgi:hypothetical protein